MATGFTYEPGSTFKAFTVAGALRSIWSRRSTVFDLPVELQVADRTITDAEPRGPETPHGRRHPRAVLERRRGDDRPRRWALSTSTTGSSDVRLRPADRQSTSRARSRGSCRRRRSYSGSTMGNLPIGQGLSVTPMQMAAAYSAIADGGILRAPQLVLDEDGHRVAEPTGHRIISSKSAAQIRTMLEGVLAPGGTASEVSVPGYTLAGKTGTAQKVDRTAPTRTPSSSPRSSASRRRRIRKLLVAIVVEPAKPGRATTAAPSRPRRSARSPSSRCPTWAFRRTREPALSAPRRRYDRVWRHASPPRYVIVLGIAASKACALFLASRRSALAKPRPCPRREALTTIQSR